MELAKTYNNSPNTHSVSLPIPVSRGAFSLEEIMTCPYCFKKSSYEEATKENKGRFIDKIICPHCKKENVYFIYLEAAHIGPK